MNNYTASPDPTTDNKDNTISPAFDLQAFEASELTAHLSELANSGQPIEHEKLLFELLNDLEPIDFQGLVFPDSDQLTERRQELEQLVEGSDKAEFPAEKAELSNIKKQQAAQRISDRHLLILTVEQLLERAKQKRWGLCRFNGQLYLFNGSHWKAFDKEVLQHFLGKAAEKFGIDHYKATFHGFQKALLEQFFATAFQSSPRPAPELVLINLKNGTFEINAATGERKLRQYQAADFLTHQLSFDYDKEATAPQFEAFLNRVLPDKELQNVLAEYLGWVFVRHSSGRLKLEQALILYGGGANGKSVLFAITQALFGRENFASFSLENLTKGDGYYRASIADKLLNYASEISTKLEATYFKQLVSGEPIEARLPYGEPLIIDNYAKLIFNCNELPKDIEHSHAFFRRFLIVPFNVTIPEAEQDKSLALKIIDKELAGIFNWVLAGLERLLSQEAFSFCEACTAAVEQYKKESDSVAQFIEEAALIPSTTELVALADLYSKYRQFCVDSGGKFLKRTHFTKRLEKLGFQITRRNNGLNVFAVEKLGAF